MSKKVTFKTAAGEDGSLTAEGADPADQGPAGTVLRLMIGILKRDNAECMKELASNTDPAGGPPGVGSSHATVKVDEVTFEGTDKAIVPTDSMIGDDKQSMAFVVVREPKGWKVDMSDTIERMMGPMMEMMTDGMKQVGEAMGAAMQAIGDGLNEALSGGGEQDRQPDELTMDGDMTRDPVVQAPAPKKKRKKAPKRR